MIAAASGSVRSPPRSTRRVADLADRAAPSRGMLGRRPHALAGRPDRGRRPARLARRRSTRCGRRRAARRVRRDVPRRRARRTSSCSAWAARPCSPRCWPARSRRGRPARPRACSTPPTRPPSPASATSARPTRTPVPRRVEVGHDDRDPQPARRTSGRDTGGAEQFAPSPIPAPRWPTLGRRARLPRRVREPARHRRPLLGAVVLRSGAGRARRRRLAGLLDGAADGRPARPDVDAADNPACGSAPSSARRRRPAATSSRSSSTDEIATFGLWLEQLVAESTGKHGTGVVPVAGEPLGPPEVYGDDRLFVAHRRRDHGARRPRRRRPPGGRARPTADPLDLGAQVLLWEIATALCGAVLGINPFDQPDVAAAKDGHQPRCSTPSGAARRSSRAARRALLDQVRPGDYVAIQAYVDPGDAALVDELERRPRRASATGCGWPPPSASAPASCTRPASSTRAARRPACSCRSSGDDPDRRRRSRARRTAFSTLKQAQAAGDLLALRRRGLRAGAGRRSTTCVEVHAMKLGMIGLGKMGGNMAERLRAGGHEVVGYDRDPTATRRRRRSRSWSPRSARRAAGRVGDGAGRRPDRRRSIDDARPSCWPRATSSSTAATRNFRDSSPHGAGAGRARHRLRRRGTSGGMWGLENGYCLMVGGDRRRRGQGRSRSSTRWRRPNGLRPRRPGRRRALHEDGPQRHRVRADAGLRRGLRAPRRRPTSASTSTPRSRSWQQGSVVRSWLLDLLVLALDADPGLDGIQGVAADSGEGRWTVERGGAARRAAAGHLRRAVRPLRVAGRGRLAGDEGDRRAAHQFGGHTSSRRRPTSGRGGRAERKVTPG